MTDLHANPLILDWASSEATPEAAGGKGASLARMAAAGLPVSTGFHVTTQAYKLFVEENHIGGAILSAASQAKADDPATLDHVSREIQALFAGASIPLEIAQAIVQAYGTLGPGDPAMAVRSSSTAEDLPEMSFAGQLETYLNVRGGDNVLTAVKRCWASLWTPRAIGYRARLGIQSGDVSLAVVVQRLVEADSAGILFTLNPVTGDRNQMMINAGWGLGEAIVSGKVTPDTFVLDTRTGAIVSQEIAQKDVMTALLSAGTQDEPVPEEKRKRAAIEPGEIAELFRLGKKIEHLYGQPMDIEWAEQGGSIFILQARPITALGETRPTLEWKLPRPRGSYWRSSVIELLPDPLSPLFATLGLPAWNDATLQLTRSLGVGELYPEQLMVTINEYAYYDLEVRFKWKVVLNMARMLPKGVRLLSRARTRWLEEARPQYAAAVAEWGKRNLSTTPATQLFAAARIIVKAAAEHYVAVQSGILPASYLTESVFTKFYNSLIKRKGDPPALVFLLGFDSVPIQAEKSLFDLATWARRQPDLAAYLESVPSPEIVAAYRSSTAPIEDSRSWGEFRSRFAEHLNSFGHAIYDLDFAKAVGDDDPAPLLEALKFYVSGQGASPYERQAAAVAERGQASRSLAGRLDPPRSRLFQLLLEKAQQYAPLREDALADVGLGWPLLRRMLREAGRRLAAASAIGEPDDIFWLKLDEAEAGAAALDAGRAVEDYRETVAARRETWERERKVTPPVVLPVQGGGRFLGMDFRKWMPARADQGRANSIKGVAASPGRVTGTARVIHGPAEFDQMRGGDILVAKITTPAWTPLFALASGLATDVGGPLSHGSIVAREYRIPAVLGTGVATERISSGQTVTVDGDAGEVTLGAALSYGTSGGRL
jgi:pyruvate,water dikinase